jgi:hypothetical protein
MRLRKLLCTATALLLFHYTTPAQSIPEVETLLAKMTLAEKIGQLNLLTPGVVFPPVRW